MLYDFFENLARDYMSILFVGNWGITIILATFVIRLVISPLVYKQQKTLMMFRALTPQVRRIRDHYDTDVGSAHDEVMRLYSKYKFSLSGVVWPWIVQAPFLIAFFLYLNSKQFPLDMGTNHSFLFINNIAVNTTSSLTLLVTMVLIYVFTQVVSSRIAAGRFEKRSLRISLALSVLILLFIVHFPVALMIYWISTSWFLILQQVVMNKTVGRSIEIEEWDLPEKSQPDFSLKKETKPKQDKSVDSL